MNLPSLTQSEQRVLGMKYKSKRIGEMDGFALSRQCKGLALKICVITGWQIPDNAEYVTIFDDQIKKKCIDDWQDINFDELEYAMRTYGVKLKDWGKALNLSLIDSCITDYLRERDEASILEERMRSDEQRYVINPNTGERKLKADEIAPPPVDWSPEWEKVIEQAKNGQISDAIIIVPIYDWLRKQKIVDKYIPGTDRWGIVEDCRTQFIEEMEQALATLKEKPHIALEKIRRLKADNWQEDAEMKSLIFNLGKIETVRQIALAIAAE